MAVAIVAGTPGELVCESQVQQLLRAGRPNAKQLQNNLGLLHQVSSIVRQELALA